MLRVALATAALTLALPAAAPAAEGTASLALCAPAERAAEFEARMTAVRGTRRMKMRFVLQARKPGSRRFRRVSAPGFSRWTGSRAARYVFTRRVEGLAGPARYRALVRFKWIGRGGRVLARDRAYSRACRQPDHRPNLRVQSLTVAGRRYFAVVANTGRTASGSFELELTPGLATARSVPVASLEPGETRTVELSGPRCGAGAVATVVADPLDLLDERSERDNRRSVSCG